MGVWIDSYGSEPFMDILIIHYNYVMNKVRSSLDKTLWVERRHPYDTNEMAWRPSYLYNPSACNGGLIWIWPCFRGICNAIVLPLKIPQYLVSYHRRLYRTPNALKVILTKINCKHDQISLDVYILMQRDRNVTLGYVNDVRTIMLG